MCRGGAVHIGPNIHDDVDRWFSVNTTHAGKVTTGRSHSQSECGDPAVTHGTSKIMQARQPPVGILP